MLGVTLLIFRWPRPHLVAVHVGCADLIAIPRRSAPGPPHPNPSPLLLHGHVAEVRSHIREEVGLGIACAV